MSVKLRMKRMGTKKRPFYRIVAADSRNQRDGRFLEIVGYYNPMVDPMQLKFDDDKVYKWLGSGATPSPNVRQLLRRAGLMERWHLLRKGAAIHELDAKLEELRAKQPKREAKPEKKRLSKKRKAAAAKSKEAAAGAEGSAKAE